ncbi:hypothetical protein [Pedobacter mucosus]|uniref:hypothetical protein n=1 Tax=Pedobacter mucosus TaxID=2895286 RepID=UPI001EE3CDC5|nr:hypothetical protein [Pedobacter mucosus]UKT64990.1 hypothetical protein LOK61_04250 [Pedobacter mucosus]
MKRSKFVPLCAIILLALTAACATKILGKIFIATHNMLVDHVFQKSRTYTAIGIWSTTGGPKSFDAVQLNIMPVGEPRKD